MKTVINLGAPTPDVLCGWMMLESGWSWRAVLLYREQRCLRRIGQDRLKLVAHVGCVLDQQPADVRSEASQGKLAARWREQLLCPWDIQEILGRLVALPIN